MIKFEIRPCENNESLNDHGGTDRNGEKPWRCCSFVVAVNGEAVCKDRLPSEAELRSWFLQYIFDKDVVREEDET